MWSTLCNIIGIPMGWIYDLVNNYGVAIILFTILLKIVLFPISLKQHKSSLAMVRLKPYQDELMKKYGSNRQKYSEELQKLYQREGYNPMSSCLPMLLQMPLLFMMYNVIRRPLSFMAHWSLNEVWTTANQYFDGKVWSDLKITSENFHDFESQILGKLQELANSGQAVQSYMTDWKNGGQIVETGKQLVNCDFLGLDLSVTPSAVWSTAFWVLIIPLLSGATSFLLSWLSQKMSPAQQAAGDQANGGSMKLMLYMMPIMSIWIAFSFPTGLGLYWLVSNLLGILQLFVLHWMYNPKKVEAEVQAKIAAEKQRDKEKRAAAAEKKAMAVQGKKKKKKQQPQSKINGEKIDD